MAKKRIKRSSEMKGSEFTKPILAGGTTILGIGVGIGLSRGNPIGGLLGGIGTTYAYNKVSNAIYKRYKKVKWR